jgi:hypothetical protein
VNSCKLKSIKGEGMKFIIYTLLGITIGFMTNNSYSMQVTLLNSGLEADVRLYKANGHNNNESELIQESGK